MKRSIDNLTDILNDFLSLSKLEEGGIENNPTLVDLQPEIRAIIEEMKEYGTDVREITYKHNGANNAELDPKLLKNILFNLISNAIKFSPVHEPIVVTSVISGEEIKISVRDRGIGISKEDQKHLFERFFRGENATYIQGTGLGLNLVEKYAELMFGKVLVESSKNTGTCFTLILPHKSHL